MLGLEFQVKDKNASRLNEAEVSIREQCEGFTTCTAKRLELDTHPNWITGEKCLRGNWTVCYWAQV